MKKTEEATGKIENKSNVINWKPKIEEISGRRELFV